MLSLINDAAVGWAAICFCADVGKSNLPLMINDDVSSSSVKAEKVAVGGGLWAAGVLVAAAAVAVAPAFEDVAASASLFDREELSVITAAVVGSITEEEDEETTDECKPAVVVVGRPAANVVGVASVLRLVAVVLAPSRVVSRRRFLPVVEESVEFEDVEDECDTSITSMLA